LAVIIIAFYTAYLVDDVHHLLIIQYNETWQNCQV